MNSLCGVTHSTKQYHFVLVPEPFSSPLQSPTARNSRLLAQLLKDHIIFLKVREYEDQHRQQNIDGGAQERMKSVYRCGSQE